jgi:hypothetical protein
MFMCSCDSRPPSPPRKPTFILHLPPSVTLKGIEHKAGPANQLSALLHNILEPLFEEKMLGLTELHLSDLIPGTQLHEHVKPWGRFSLLSKHHGTIFCNEGADTHAQDVIVHRSFCKTLYKEKSVGCPSYKSTLFLFWFDLEVGMPCNMRSAKARPNNPSYPALCTERHL